MTPAPPTTPRPENACDWCDADLDTQVAYVLETQSMEDTETTAFRVGSNCCISRGKHADYCNDFQAKWGKLPDMHFDFEPTPENVTRMFTDAKRLHARKCDRYLVSAAFRCAWYTFRELSPDEQTLVVR